MAVAVSLGVGVGVSGGVSVTVAVAVTVSVGVAVGVLVTVDVWVAVVVAVGPGHVPSHAPAPVSACTHIVCPALHVPATPPEQSTAESQHARTAACELAQAILHTGKQGPGMFGRQYGAIVPEYDSQTQHMASARGAAERITIAATITAAAKPRRARRRQSRPGEWSPMCVIHPHSARRSATGPARSTAAGGATNY